MPSSDSVLITILEQPIKVKDEFGQIGLLVSMNSVKTLKSGLCGRFFVKRVSY